MATKTSARHALRAATSADHDAVDRAFGKFSLACADDYAAFLAAQAAAFLAVEDAIDRSAPERVMDDWPSRRRAALLRRDLAELDRAVPVVRPLPPFETPAEVLGAIYVLEGSRLGGQLLVRDVPDSAPRAFLLANDSAAWRSLVAELDRVLLDDDQRALAISAAKGVFAVFERAAWDQHRIMT